MYTRTLGAVPKCLTIEQAQEASRLCNCKRYGSPSAPKISGIGYDPRGDAGTAVINVTGSNGCEPEPRVRMPADFNPQDPCEALSRTLCPTLTRPTTPSSPTVTEQSKSYEETAVSRAMTAQTLMVGGLLALVLVGGGFFVYRVSRS